MPDENARATVLFCHGTGGNITYRSDASSIRYVNRFTEQLMPEPSRTVEKSSKAGSGR